MNGNKHTITASSSLSASAPDGLAEDRMRQSLSRLGEVALQRPGRSSHTTGSSGHGLGGQVARRRFVQDGEVPTTYASTGSSSDVARAASDPSEAVDAAQSELARERTTHAETRDQLKQAQATIQRLQTRLGHMELEMQETRSRADQAVAASATRAADDRPIRPRKPREPLSKANLDLGSEPQPEPVKWWVRS